MRAALISLMIMQLALIVNIQLIFSLHIALINDNMLIDKRRIIMGFGSRLRDILKEKNMTIKELSTLTGISINTLYSITKRDTRLPSNDILTQIASELNVSIAYLMGFIDDSTSQHPGIDAFIRTGTTDSPLFLDLLKRYNINGNEYYLNELSKLLDSLNTKGKEEAVKRVNELTLIDEYKYKEIIDKDKDTFDMSNINEDDLPWNK